MDWAQVLVIILSLFLVIFLAAAITLVVMLIRVTHQIRQVTTAAQHAVSVFGQNASRVQLVKVARFIVKAFAKLKKNK